MEPKASTQASARVLVGQAASTREWEHRSAALKASLLASAPLLEGRVALALGPARQSVAAKESRLVLVPP